MSIKRTTEQAKQESENAVLRQLAIKSPQRWSDLLTNTKISSRTLKKALDRLEKKGFVYRQVKQGKDYPPPVLYGLSPKGKEISDPIFFAINARPYVLGLDVEWIAKGKDVTIDVTTKNMKEQMVLMGKRIAAFRFFTLLKGIEERNTDWVSETNQLIGYDPFTMSALGVTDGKIQFFGKVEALRDQFFMDYSDQKITYMINSKKLMSFKKLLKEIYPEEIKKFEKILESQSNISNKKRK